MQSPSVKTYQFSLIYNFIKFHTKSIRNVFNFTISLKFAWKNNRWDQSRKSWKIRMKFHRPMQQTRVWSPIQEDHTCCGATKPECHYWACAQEPRSCSYRARMLQPTEAGCPRACALQQKPLQWEACTLQLESSPHLQQPQKSPPNNKKCVRACVYKMESLLYTWNTVNPL